MGETKIELIEHAISSLEVAKWGHDVFFAYTCRCATHK